MTERIVVIGLGKLGLPYALLLDEAGCEVLAVDSNQSLIHKLDKGELNLSGNSSEPQVDILYVNRKKIRFISDLRLVQNFGSTIMIFVPTPTGSGEDIYDHTILSNLLFELNELRLTSTDIVICCTIYPQYINDVGDVLLDKCKDCTLSYNPFFIALGNVVNGYKQADQILIGADTIPVLSKIERINLYVNKNKDVVISKLTTLEAEITKLAINSYLCIKIAYANCIGDYATRSNCKDVQPILDAIGSDKRIGCEYFNYADAYGGPCLPRDCIALSLNMKRKGVNPLLPMAADAANKHHKECVLMKYLQSNVKEVNIKSLTYKPDCNPPIIEESSRLSIAEALVYRGKEVTLEDRSSVLSEIKKKKGNFFKYKINEELDEIKML